MRIIVLDGYTLNPGDLSWDALKEYGEVVIYDRSPAGKVLERAAGAEALFTNKTPLGEDIFNKLPKLKYVGVLATGYNIIHVEAARKNGVTVTNIPDYGSYSVAQFTFALLLELCHHVQRHSDAVMKGKWSASADWCFWEYPLTELAGKTLGVIGFGKIGQKVADIATAFGMNILGTARHQSSQSHRRNFRWVEIPELLEQSDVVSLHCPLTPETKGLINARTLKTMKTTAFLLNTSRGPLVVDLDLADAVNQGVIAGAALDVLSIEPPPKNNPLFKAKNCIITPHIAWATKEARSRLMEMAVKNLAAFVASKPVNVVT
jgi:glycerate dehydrogenase